LWVGRHIKAGMVRNLGHHLSFLQLYSYVLKFLVRLYSTIFRLNYFYYLQFLLSFYIFLMYMYVCWYSIIYNIIFMCSYNIGGIGLVYLLHD
jgi:hypothetical protein